MTLPRSYLRLSSHTSGFAQALVHADVEVGHQEHRRLEAVGEVEALRRELEALVRILGEEQDVLGVAVRGVGAGEDVGLLGARGHAGRGAAALHIDDRGRDLGEVAQADELAHQRDARAARGGEGARAVPAGAGHDSDGGELVLGLDDRELVLAGFLVDAQAHAMAREGFGERRGRRDRVPGAHRGAAVDAAERRRGVAFDEDLVADVVGALHLQPHRVLEMGARVVEPHVEGVEVGLEELLLALVLLADQLGDYFGLDARASRRARRRR